MAQLGLAWPGLARFLTSLGSPRARERCQGTIAQFFAPPDLWANNAVSLANLKISEPFGADNGTTGPQATSFVGGASLAQLGLAWPGLARFFTRLSSARIRERCQGTIAQFFAPPDLWVFSLTFPNHNKKYIPIYMYIICI